MSKYLAPLGIFVTGHIFMLMLFLFFPALGDSVTALNASVNETVKATFWGWEWVSGSIRVWVFLFSEMFILGATAIAFIKCRTLRY